MALFVNFIPNMVSQIEGRHFAWKPKIVSKLEYPYGVLLFECFSSDSWSKFSSWIAQRGISSLLINHNAEALSFIESVIYNDNFWGAIKYLYCNLWISHSSNAESELVARQISNALVIDNTWQICNSIVWVLFFYNHFFIFPSYSILSVYHKLEFFSFSWLQLPSQ